ncbi:retrovirus-related pol polyprotein from transposon TNT 1-94 [Tanacetum coccineum]
MEKGEGEENINSILNNFNSKMSHIMNMDGWEDPKVSAMKNNVELSQPKPSFVKVVSGSSDVRQNPKVKFKAITNSEKVEHSDFVLPVAAVKAVKHKFENSLVGFFVGKKVAFPLVKNYVTNTWAKFGFEKVMSDDDGLFYFKFASSNGLEQVLEQGPWLIRNIPLILTKWSPNISLSKDEVTRVPIWVKFHKVPVVAYSEDGLGLIETQVGTPIMLDAYTSDMCVDTWGRMGFARALIEVSANKELKQEVMMVVPNIDKEGEDHTLVKIKVEYEWKPPIYLECHVFRHGPDRCPKRVVEIDAPTVEANEDGFIQVVNRKSKGKSISSNPKGNFGGVKVNNAKKMFKWEPVKNPKSQEPKEKHDEQNNGIKLKNLFEKLSDQEDNIFDGNNGETSGGQ